MTDEVAVPEEMQQALQEIQYKISLLSSTPKENLKGAIKELSTALLHNPAACALLLPEDIGAAVQALYKLTGATIQQKETKPKKGSQALPKFSQIDLSPENLARIEQEM